MPAEVETARVRLEAGDGTRRYRPGGGQPGRGTG